MAGPPKKSRKESESESDGNSGDGESDSGSYDGQKEIQATFEGRNPESVDFHGIKQLLQQLFLKAHLDLTQLTDMLINQQGIGSVLKQSIDSDDDDDDEDEAMDTGEQENVFGITSVVNLRAHMETPCIKQLFTLLNQTCKQHASESVSNAVTEIVKSNSRLGFLVNERFVNVPAKLAAVMLESLHSEIERRKKKDASYDFQHYIMICKTCKNKEQGDSEFFVNDEEEMFSKAADVTFAYSVEHEADTGLGGKWNTEDKQVIPYRRILIFKAEKFKGILDKIADFTK
nr:unnamed protein product [Callosobruchus chinensis]